MAKVVLSPAIQDFTDLRPMSRGVAFSPRPNSRLSSRPGSAGISRTEKGLFETPRTERSRTSLEIPMPNSGRRSLSVISFSSNASSKSADPKLSAIEVESILREKLRVNFAEMRQALQTLDAEKDMSLTVSEFRRVLESFCFPLTQEQFKHIMKKAKVNRDGSVNYLEFLERLHQRGGTPDGLKWLGSLHKFNQTMVTAKEQGFGDVEQQIKTKISGQLQAVLKAIRLFDYNRDGQIQRHELRRVLENFCFKLTDEQFERLWCKYDMTRNGHTLDYMDFLRRLGVDTHPKTRPRTASRAKDSAAKPKFLATNKRPLSGASSRDGSPSIITVKDLERKLRTKMVENYENIKRAFVAFDRRGDGFVTLDELKRALTHFAFPMSDTLFEELMRRCGVRANHKIGYEQFLDKFQEPRASGNGQTIPIKPSHKYNPIRESEDMPTTEDIWKFLFSKVTDSFTSIKQAFLVFDDNKDGRITRRDFRRILESFCFRMTEEQFHELMAKIDPRNKGFISYLEFLDRFEHRETPEAHPWLMGDNSNKSISPPAVLAWSTVEDILRSKIMDNWKSIATAYVNMDNNRDGTISRDELRRLMDKFCLPVSDDHFDMLWNQCDVNSDGHVDFQEFLSNLGVDIVSGDFNGLSTRIHDESEAKAGLMKSDQFFRHLAAYDRAQDLTGQKTANEVMDILKEHISQRSSDMRKTFVRFDGDGDGKLSRKEFREVLDSLGLYMTDDQYRILSARLGFHKGKLTYRDFLDNFQDRRSVNIGERVEYPSQRHNQPVHLDHSVSAEEVEAQLRGKLQDGFLDLRAAFTKIDFDKNGLITRAEFRRILDSLLLFMSDEEFEKLMTRLNLMKGDKLSYREFLKRFEHVEKIEEGHPWLYSNHTFNETKDLQYLSAERADQIIKKKAIEQLDDLTRAFLTFDRDGNGIVTKKELRKVLHRFQIPVNKEEFKKLWNMYDTDGNGYVDHREFIARLGGLFVPGDTHGISTQITHGSNQEMQRFHEAQKNIHENATVNQAQAVSFLSALEVEQRLRDRFRDGYESLRKAFEAIDFNRDGYITTSEMQKVLFDFHYFLDEQQFNILLERCGLSGRSKLSYERFLSAFQDNRHAGYGRATLDTPTKRRASPVVFESHETLPAERAIEKLREKISSNFNNLKKAFSAFDGAGVGLITTGDLHQIINAFCFYMTDKQFKVLLKQLGTAEDGLVSYSDFLESFQKSDTEASHKWLERLLPQSQRRHRSPEHSTYHRHHDMTEEDVKRRVKEVVMARFYSLAKAFTDADTSSRGTASQHTFKRILDEHVFRMNEQQFDHIWNSLPKAPDGHVDYREFLKMYSARNDVIRSQSATPPREEASRQSLLSPMMSPASLKSPSPVTPPLNATEVERKIKNQVCKNWQQLHKSFRNIDQENSGQVNFQQLKDVLDQHRIYLSHSELLALWGKHSTDSKGRIVYKDFLKHFVLATKSPDDSKLSRPKLQPTKVPSSPGVRSDELIDVMATIRDKVRQDWKEMRRSFRAIDKEGSGTCSPIEFRQMLKRFKIELNEEQFFHVYSFYDKNLIGKISYNEFLRAHLE